MDMFKRYKLGLLILGLLLLTGCGSKSPIDGTISENSLQTFIDTGVSSYDVETSDLKWLKGEFKAGDVNVKIPMTLDDSAEFGLYTTSYDTEKVYTSEETAPGIFVTDNNDEITATLRNLDGVDSTILDFSVTDIYLTENSNFDIDGVKFGSSYTKVTELIGFPNTNFLTSEDSFRGQWRTNDGKILLVLDFNENDKVVSGEIHYINVE